MPHLRDRPSGGRKWRVQPLLRAARARLRLGRRRQARHPRADRGRPGVALALQHAAPRRSAGGQRERSGLDAARAGAPVRERRGCRRGVPQARPLEPDALVQGPRRRRGGCEGEGVRSRDALGDVHRQPRERGRGARSRDGNPGSDLLPGRARAGEVPGDDGLRRHRLRRPRQLRRLLAGSSASSRARSSGGSSTSISAPTTRRDRRRLRSRSPSSSAGRRPTPS